MVDLGFISFIIVFAFLYVYEDIFSFIEKLQRNHLEYKRKKLEKYEALFKEGLITYAEFKKNTK